MHILNIMLGRGKGGIEQCFVDYSDALRGQGHRVSALIHPKAAIKNHITAASDAVYEIGNQGKFDLIAWFRIRKLIRTIQPDFIILHGNRAMQLTPKKLAPRIGVTHNYSYKSLLKMDAIFATTPDLREHMTAKGFKGRLYDIPNMVRIDTSLPHKEESSPLVVGTMGRFLPEKGFNLFLDAIALAKEKTDVPFRTIIAGDGPELNRLRTKTISFGLENSTEFLGWIDDQQHFFEECDIFCLPSRNEAFGIVLLEAFAFKKPVITTDAKGPSYLTTHEENALVSPVGNPVAFSENLVRLVEDQALRQKLSDNGFAHVQHFEISHVGAMMTEALTQVKHQFNI